MKTIALIALLAPVAAFASSDQTLRNDCSNRSTSTNEYEFVYTKGKLGCNERQYNQYLASLDPALVMGANPTAAGKPAIEEHKFTYRKGKLKSGQ
ncbi:hypothetical protein [Inhella gelatinilytica]|uniref:Uncharacterized protein n=1 Tax=Inhella gelatinilytica TaxID=2795030 RepID=A0A931ITX2_9BURK|nr:hypothetical protein [Inhella gelatinilytica]MBH9551456.1 hypothetical protein [Inhella gelatinilytica]